LFFLEIPFADWESWQKETSRTHADTLKVLPANNFSGNGFGKSSLSLIKSLLSRKLFSLLSEKPTAVKNIIKNTFILKEHESGQIIVKSVSEGHRIWAKLMGIRDGCLYINCQNLDLKRWNNMFLISVLKQNPRYYLAFRTP